MTKQTASASSTTQTTRPTKVATRPGDRRAATQPTAPTTASAPTATQYCTTGLTPHYPSLLGSRDNVDVPDLTEDATRQLYAVVPDEFMAKRNELADQARKNGDTGAANAISKLRKPTVGAWIVNAYVLEDPSVVDRLTKLGDRLRAAQDKLDATKLRELTAERRDLVNEVTTEAFRRADRTQPTAALRDEVSGTFEAAIADEDIAARLGRLQRAEQWSGFGFLPTGAPELTLVRGGKENAPKQPAKHAKTAPAKPKVTAAEKRKRQRALATAQDAFDEADNAFDEARSAEQEYTQQVRQLTKKLAKLQEQLDDAREQLEQARKDVTSTRAQRREARSALDRAEREAATD
jgi:hypothetical protein